MSRPLTFDELHTLIRAAEAAAARERARFLILVNPVDFERIPPSSRKRFTVESSRLVPAGSAYVLGGRTVDPLTGRGFTASPVRAEDTAPEPMWRKSAVVAWAALALLVVAVAVWLTR